MLLINVCKDKGHETETVKISRPVVHACTCR